MMTMTSNVENSKLASNAYRSQPQPPRVTWHQRSRDHSICHISYRCCIGTDTLSSRYFEIIRHKYTVSQKNWDTILLSISLLNI